MLKGDGDAMDARHGFVKHLYVAIFYRRMIYTFQCRFVAVVIGIMFMLGCISQKYWVVRVLWLDYKNM